MTEEKTKIRLWSFKMTSTGSFAGIISTLPYKRKVYKEKIDAIQSRERNSRFVPCMLGILASDMLHPITLNID